MLKYLIRSFNGVQTVLKGKLNLTAKVAGKTDKITIFIRIRLIKT